MLRIACRAMGEWLGQFIFETIEPLGECFIHLSASEKAQDQATECSWTYSNERPNMGIGGITPAMKLKMVARIL